MAAHAGERAWKTGTFICQECNEQVRVKQGDTIPRCPNGHTTYDERVDEPAGQRSRATSLGRRRRSGRAEARPRSAVRSAGRTRKAAKRPARKAGARSSTGRSRTTGARKTSRASPRKRTPARRATRRAR